MLAPGAGWFDLRGVLTLDGAQAVGQVGYRIAPWLETYAEGRVTQPWGGRTSAFFGAGFRGRFGKRQR